MRQAEASRGDLYRKYAEMCFRIAHSVATDAQRARWIEMGQHLVEWANEADGEALPIG